MMKRLDPHKVMWLFFFNFLPGKRKWGKVNALQQGRKTLTSVQWRKPSHLRRTLNESGTATAREAAPGVTSKDKAPVKSMRNARPPQGNGRRAAPRRKTQRQRKQTRGHRKGTPRGEAPRRAN